MSCFSVVVEKLSLCFRGMFQIGKKNIEKHEKTDNSS